MDLTKNRLSRRVTLYFVGMFSYACGACLSTKAALGLTPITSISYVLSLYTQWSLGTVMLTYNVVVLILERLLYGRIFQRKNYLQLPLSVVFSGFIDVCMYLFRTLDGADILPRIGFFTLALALMGLGVGGMMCGDFIPLPAEGLVKALSFRFQLEFGRAKMGHDCVIVALTAVLSLVLLRRLEGIQVGTVVAALLLGPISRMWIKGIRRFILPEPAIENVVSAQS